MPSDTIISVENLSKRYRLGASRSNERYTALRDVIADKAKSLFRRNGRVTFDRRSPTADDFWALKDASFEVKQGEVVGIIGRNGAGKSTLLKILSRITEPTEGKIRIKGRVASLLEVGTGFHPELTGRENVFLNGAILGMHRSEIKGKFDEIVAFAEIEKFLDTPVKRYSSGMYVRLAFAVAAHLEPEILIIDEVLAVGDTEFQKKCLGKMREVSEGRGRTVLFVSHNMATISALCSRVILLSKGTIEIDGSTGSGIASYTGGGNGSAAFTRRPHSNGSPTLVSGRVFMCDTRVRFELRIDSRLQTRASLYVRLVEGNRNAVGLGALDGFNIERALSLGDGVTTILFELDPHALATGKYLVSLDLAYTIYEFFDRVEDCLEFEIDRPPRGDAARVLRQDWAHGCYELPLVLIDQHLVTHASVENTLVDS